MKEGAIRTSAGVTAISHFEEGVTPSHVALGEGRFARVRAGLLGFLSVQLSNSTKDPTIFGCASLHSLYDMSLHWHCSDQISGVSGSNLLRALLVAVCCFRILSREAQLHWSE